MGSPILRSTSLLYYTCIFSNVTSEALFNNTAFGSLSAFIGTCWSQETDCTSDISGPRLVSDVGGGVLKRPKSLDIIAHLGIPARRASWDKSLEEGSPYDKSGGSDKLNPSWKETACQAEETNDTRNICTVRLCWCLTCLVVIWAVFPWHRYNTAAAV